MQAMLAPPPISYVPGPDLVVRTVSNEYRQAVAAATERCYNGISGPHALQTHAVSSLVEAGSFNPTLAYRQLMDQEPDLVERLAFDISQPAALGQRLIELCKRLKIDAKVGQHTRKPERRRASAR